MAAVTPKKRTRSWRTYLSIGVVALLLAACVGGALVFQRRAAEAALSSAASAWKPSAASSGSIEASVSATGSVAPASQAELRFVASGTVTEVLVKAGDKVQAGQPLARIDNTDLKLALEKAQADLAQAQADVQKLQSGATPAEIAQAQAAIAQAQGQLQQAVGNVTPADLAAARAKLDEARAKLTQTLAGPEATDVRTSQAELEQAQTGLEEKRNSLSSAKTSAQLALDKAANALTQAQSAYATARTNWDYVQDTGKDPSGGVGANGKQRSVSDTERQQFYDTFVQAEAALKSAETAVQGAQVDFDNARQAEVTGIATAQQQVTVAQNKLAATTRAPKADAIASARAAVQSAQADLSKLTGANHAGSVNAARAGVESAQAALAKLRADPKTSELASLAAAVARAEAGVKQAKLDEARATLQAPFAGTVARVSLRVGEPSSGVSSDSAGSTSSTSSAGIVLTDLSSFHVDMPVDELDVARIKVGFAARISVDALPETALTGKVTNIEPLATTNDKGANTYKVTVTLDPTDAAVLPGMTAATDVITVKKESAVLVPRRAVQIENGKNVVYVPQPGGQPDPLTKRPASERREVTLGLSNNENIEIVKGVKVGEQVLVPDVVSTFNPVNN